MDVGLINFNQRGVVEAGVPPVPPIGLEYLADDLEDAGHGVALLDLCFVSDGERAQRVAEFVHDKDFIGITFRNLGVDSLALWLRDGNFYAPALRETVDMVRAASDAPIVLGGQGFSIYPERVLAFAGADYGIAGPGERAFRDLLAGYGSLPRGTILRGPANTAIAHRRGLIDYGEYIARGGCPAVQTKNGCPFACAFCVESRKTLYRAELDRSINEIKVLLGYYERAGVERKLIFISDAEFNNHRGHAEAFCDRIVEEGLEFEWSCYLNAIPMTRSLAEKMKRAGCVIPCVSVVSGDDAALEALDTRFTADDIRRCAEHLHAAGLPFTVDVMPGGPGETLDSAKRTHALVDAIDPVVAGLNLGVRLYANTGFGRAVKEGRFPVDGCLYGCTENNDDMFYPIFYISDMRIGEYFEDVCDSDPRYRLLGYSEFGGINYKTARGEN